MPGVAVKPCWQQNQRAVNLGQLAPGWHGLITAKHRGEPSGAIEQGSAPTWPLRTCTASHSIQNEIMIHVSYDFK